jgi:uncharacterized membrane protein YgcG
MEQRPLRLGDILDDYCPRERRVTNHAIVAMIGEDVKQTRCTTCDAEHAYKGGRQPRRRKKDAPAALYREVLAGMGEADLAVAAVAAGAGDVAIPALVPPVLPSSPTPTPDAPASLVTEAAPLTVSRDEPADDDRDEEVEEPADAPRVEEGPVHRRLIRATLPRPEGVVKETRPIPEFTMHRNNGRGQFRGHSRGNGNGSGNGHRNGGGRRFGGGFRGGNSPRPGGGGKKRSR